MASVEKTVGVLGGMGPAATVDFMRRVIELTQGQVDQDHLHMLVDHNPKVPDRQAAINGTGASVGPPLAAMAQRLEAAGADFLVMVCNTAHAFAADIERAVSIPLISIIDATVAEIGQNPSVNRVGILATRACLSAGLYQNALTAAGLKHEVLDDAGIEECMQLILRVKAGDLGQEVREGMHVLADSLVRQDAEVVIAGCTEIPLVLQAAVSGAPVVCSTSVLAQATIDYARGQRGFT